MENLYALAVKGKTYYCLGKIDETQLRLVENIANRLDVVNNTGNKCEDFCRLVREELNILLTPISVEYVFRKL